MRGGSNRLLSPEEVAAKLGVSRKTLDRHYIEWGLRRITLTARAVRFRERDIDNFIGSIEWQS